MIDREKVIKEYEDFVNRYISVSVNDDYVLEMHKAVLALLKEQDDLLKHEYWRGYNNGRADERGLQEGTIMQTFSPD